MCTATSSSTDSRKCKVPADLKGCCSDFTHYCFSLPDAIRWMCPFGSCMPDSSRLRFYGQFFEKIYDEYFGNRYSVHAFEYEYMSVVATKLVK